MASAGTLYVNIAANTQKLTKGLAAARAQVNKFGRLAFGGMATAATVAGAAVVKSFRDVAPEIDNIAKASDRLNVSTRALSGLAHAAELSGSSLEGLAKGMTLMTRNVGEAVSGGGAIADTFERLGLSAHQLQNMSADEMFLRVAEAINKLPNAAAKTSAAMDIFGRSGAALMPLLSEGSEGIKAMQADAEKLGITFTREQAAMVEAANDANTRISAAFKGIKTQLTVGISPAITAASNAFADWASSMNAVERGSNSLAKGLGVVADVAWTVRLGFMKVQSVITDVLAFIARKVSDVVQFVIRTANKIPGVNIEGGGLDVALAEELERTSAALDAKFQSAFRSKTPSERIAAAQSAATTAAKPEPVPIQMPPEVESVFTKIGGLIAGASSLPGKAGEAIGAAANLMGSKKDLGATPALALAKSGSAESYRQQAAIRRQGDSQKVGKEHLKEAKTQTGLMQQMVSQGFALLPANLFGGS